MQRMNESRSKRRMRLQRFLMTFVAGVLATGSFAVGDDVTGEAFLSPAPLRSRTTLHPITANASLSEQVLTSANRENNDPDWMPSGALRIRARIALSGYPALEHRAWRLPPELTPAEFPGHPKFVRLPDGGAYASGPILGCTCGHKNFPSWGFFNVFGTLAQRGERVSLLDGAPCISAHAFEHDDWGSAELVFERQLDSGESMRMAIRTKRIPEDPFLYMLVAVEPAGGRVHSVNLSGVPFASNPPKQARRQRYMWAMGETWNMHDDKQKRLAEVTAASECGAFWYNRGHGESGGMSAVFLPEDVLRIRAGGTWMVGLTLEVAQPLLRLAIYEWEDFRGWEAALRVFKSELGERRERLQEMSFVWPIEDTLSSVQRNEAARYLAMPGLAEAMRADALARLQPLRDAVPPQVDLLNDDNLLQGLMHSVGGGAGDVPGLDGTGNVVAEKLRKELAEATRKAEQDPFLPLREALRACDAALDRLRGMPLEDSSDRYVAEREALLSAQAVREELARVRAVWVKSGGEQR